VKLLTSNSLDCIYSSIPLANDMIDHVILTVK
jgi:hypothetical protein